MSRQKRDSNLVGYDDEDDYIIDSGDEEEHYEEEEEKGSVLTKEDIEKHYKSVREVVAGDATRKDILASLEKNKYDVCKAIEEIKKNIAEKEKKKKETTAAVKKEETKKEVPKKTIVLEEEKKVVHKVHSASIEPPKDLNKIYPNIEYKCLAGLEEDKGNNISLVTIGHVDSGKSTLMGHFLFKLGYVTPTQMHQYEKESKILGKATFQFAYAFDETQTERERGVTINIAVKHFQLKDKNITIIDAPGHKDFIPNMISGAAQADCAILVIDSKKPAFEAGFLNKGQTKEHAILARCLGVTQIIVAVNKLDLHGWEEGVYTNIVNNVEPFLLSIGYKQESIKFVPISGLQGENLIESSKIPELTSWYKGPCLGDIICSFKPLKKALNKPIRACVSDCYVSSFDQIKGTCFSVKMEGGAIEEGNKLVLMPFKAECVVKGIMVNDEKKKFTVAGETAEIAVSLCEGIDATNIRGGAVLSSIEHCIYPILAFRAQIVTFELHTPITLGYPIFLHCYSLKSQAKITKIEKSTCGLVEKKNPKSLMSNTHAVVIITAQEHICLELYQNYHGLGRIAIRDSVGTLATGMIMELIK